METRSTLTQTGTLWARFKTWSTFGLVLLSGCGQIKNSTSTLMTDCVLNTDQAETLTGRWVQPAVPIAFHTGDWNASEISAMIAAADKWNAFFAASMGYAAIDYGSAANPRTSSSPLPVDERDFCTSNTIVNSDGTFSGVVVFYKNGAWSNDSSFIALTHVCNIQVNTTRKQVPRSQNAYTEINYSNFFVNGNRVPDLQSIVLHEMGHLMGINHSCMIGNGTSGFPSCSSGSLNASYRTASLYPTFSFSSTGTGEIRRSLNSNDEGRMNCIYKYL
jgi:hypothetical protein